MKRNRQARAIGEDIVKVHCSQRLFDVIEEVSNNDANIEYLQMRILSD